MRVRRKWVAIVASFTVLAVGAFLAGQWVLPRYLRAVVEGKAPRKAVAIVVRKEAGSMAEERHYVWYRVDAFQDVDATAQAAILKREQARYEAEGPRREWVDAREYPEISVGQRRTILYAYYPSVLWGVSDEIRVPW